MLTSILINNFTIIDNLELEFNSNMSVLTGETGAGKSIIIDSLDLALGGRNDSKTLRNNASQCEIVATFDITNIQEVQAWLEDQELTNDDNNECLLRRIIKPDGRSKSYINGIAVPTQLTRELASYLVDIRAQHEHYALLNPAKQRNILDEFANHSELLKVVTANFREWQKLKEELNNLNITTNDGENRLDFLNYQLEELEKLDIQENELEELHQEHKQLTSAETILSAYSNALNILQEDDEKSVLNNIYNSQKELQKIATLNPELSDIISLLDESLVPLQTATQELKDYLNNTDLNPERLAWLEQRLNSIYDLARKHRTTPENLYSHYQNLQQEVAILQTAAERLSSLQNEIAQAQQTYLYNAQKLSRSRSQAAQKLSKLVTQKMHELGMASGKFVINIASDEKNCSSHGIDHIEFLVTSNPGHPPATLNKVASGGELSRISLAIQVIAANQTNNTTLIFDEVDVGIGGKTAEIVGQMLREIGTNNQILCITHLPQVAACGHNHIMIEKSIKQKQTLINASLLTPQQRIQEIARMLGGITITEKTLAHAEEMLGMN